MQAAENPADPNRISILFSFLMGLVYLGLGIFILLKPEKFQDIPMLFRFALGSLFIVYALFRLYRNYKKLKDLKNLIIIAFLASTVYSCSNGTGKNTDTPTTGSIKIASDETYQPLIESEVETFNALYPHAEINANYLSEGDAFQALMDDSVRLIIASRDLNDAERDYFKKIPITPRTIPIAKDAIAIILHLSNPDSNYTTDQIKMIFSGKLPTWKNISDGNLTDSIRIVFDHKNSSTARFIKEKFLGDKQFPSNCYALKKNTDVIEYVSTHPNAMGIIGVNWISDGEDPASLDFLKKIKVAGLASEDPMDPDFYKPFQAYIAQKKYPLIRNIYIVSREARTGLGTGFAAFVAGDKGQRIILKSGLIPETMPVRIVGFRG